MKIRHRVDYREARGKAYFELGVGEQLDALWKAVRALQANKPIPADAVAVIEKIDAVKRRHPKD